MDKRVKKIALGQFFTKETVWLQPQVRTFIKDSGCRIAYDPFAGKGDLLRAVSSFGFLKYIGLDIDEQLCWTHNDSLQDIPTGNRGKLLPMLEAKLAEMAL